MKPIQANEKQSLKQKMIAEIKQYILNHQLKAGDQLPTERAMTEMFGVSRSVVREALSYLENVGIIQISQGKGAFLQESNIEKLLTSFFFLWQINNANIKEMLSLRIVFECGAVDEVLRQTSIESIEKLRKLVDEAKNIKHPDLRREADIQFHQALLQATNNDLFIQMTNIITSYFFQIQHLELSEYEYKESIQEHEEIVRALESKQANLAKELLTKHLSHAKA